MSTDDQRKRGRLARGMLVLVAATLGIFVAAAPVAAQLTTGTISGVSWTRGAWRCRAPR